MSGSSPWALACLRRNDLASSKAARWAASSGQPRSRGLQVFHESTVIGSRLSSSLTSRGGGGGRFFWARVPGGAASNRSDSTRKPAVRILGYVTVRSPDLFPRLNGLDRVLGAGLEEAVAGGFLQGIDAVAG